MSKTLDEVLQAMGYVDVMGGPITSTKEVEGDLSRAYKKRCEDIILVTQHLAGDKYYTRLYVKKEDFEDKY